MPTYISMLRGINVGGHKKIAMSELKALYVAIGHTDVITYIQSGNVIFRSQSNRPDALAGSIERRIARDLGFEVAVLLRSKDELRQVIDRNPFPAREAGPATLYVTFLRVQPEKARLAAVETEAKGSDVFRARGREIYLHCPKGYGQTKLTNALWERRLGTAATTRNWSTVTKLLQLAGG